jgi:hypothetical protein
MRRTPKHNWQTSYKEQHMKSLEQDWLTTCKEHQGTIKWIWQSEHKED